MDLIIRRIERIHEVELSELEHGIQDEGIEQICANILYLRVCVSEGMTLHILHKSIKLVDKNWK